MFVCFSSKGTNIRNFLMTKYIILSYLIWTFDLDPGWKVSNTNCKEIAANTILKKVWFWIKCTIFYKVPFTKPREGVVEYIGGWCVQNGACLLASSAGECREASRATWPYGSRSFRLRPPTPAWQQQGKTPSPAQNILITLGPGGNFFILVPPLPNLWSGACANHQIILIQMNSVTWIIAFTG